MSQLPVTPRGDDGLSGDDFPQVGTEAWGRMSQRCAELIRKMIKGELTAEEQIEYEILQRRSLAAVEKTLP
jgi:hypothetical protein